MFLWTTWLIGSESGAMDFDDTFIDVDAMGLDGGPLYCDGEVRSC